MSRTLLASLGLAALCIPVLAGCSSDKIETYEVPYHKQRLLGAEYWLCMERARAYTQVYRETEGEAPALREGLLDDLGEMLDAPLAGWPEGDGRIRSAIRRAQQDDARRHRADHLALEGKPVLAVRLQTLGLGKLGEERLFAVGSKVFVTLDVIAGGVLLWSALDGVHEETGGHRRPTKQGADRRGRALWVG